MTWVRALITLSLAVTVAMPVAAADAGKAKKSTATDDGTFSEPRVLQFKIELPPAALDALRKDPKEYVKGTVREGERTFETVGVRFKGEGAETGGGERPGFTLKFNEFITDQAFHGQKKITLDPLGPDPTLMTELLANDLFRTAGVPAPRSAFARIDFNGKDCGVYLLTEGINRDFLARHFDKTKGNFYEGTRRDINGKLDKDSGDEGNTQADVARLVAAAQEADPAARWKQLEQVLDLDGFLSFAALEVMVGHTNGYCLATNKYRLYHDPAADQMVFIPHGIEVVFGNPTSPVLPEMRGMVARAVLGHPQGRQKYLERMSKLLATDFKAERLHARIDQVAAKLRPAIATMHSNAGPSFDKAVADLKARITQRVAFLDQQLKAGVK